MKDPTRLLDASASELELRLLRAGAVEQPPAAAMQRLLEKLGGQAAPASLQPAATTTKLSLLPIGMAALGITLAGVVWVATRSTPPSAASKPALKDAPQGPRQLGARVWVCIRMKGTRELAVRSFYRSFVGNLQDPQDFVIRRLVERFVPADGR